MSLILVEIPLRSGDHIIIKDRNGTIVKQGMLTSNPSSSILPYSDFESGQRSFYFSDTVFVMENVEYTIEVPKINKVFRVRPVPSFKEVIDCINYLANLKSGDAYESFRESVLNDFIQKGYSEVRANQVIDELISSLKNK